MRRFATVLALSSLAMMTVAAGDVTYEATESNYYMSNTGSGCGADAVYQLLSAPQPGGPNCGFVGGAPFSEVFAATGDTEFGTNTYAGLPGQETILDTSRAVEGQITIMHGSGLVGVGQFTIDLVLTGRTLDTNKTVTLGSVTAGSETAGVGKVTFVYSLDLDEQYSEVAFSTFTLSSNVRGLHANSGYTSSQGDSFFTLPTLTPLEEPSSQPAG